MRKSLIHVGALPSRQGAMIVLVGLLLTIIFFFAAVVVDHGYTSVTKARLQTAADSATLAGIDALADEQRLESKKAARRVARNAIAVAEQMIDLNWPPELTFNPRQDAQIEVGIVNADGEFFPSDLEDATAISVTVLASDVSMFFAPVLGVTEAHIGAQAVASFETKIEEIRIKTPGTRAPVLPIAIHIDKWRQRLDGHGDDHYSWNEEYKVVQHGSDDLTEIDVFTGEKNSEGQFGTVNIGRKTNSMNSLTDQIVNGLSEGQLAKYGGALTLDPYTGTMELGGDPGMGGPVFEAAFDIIGQTRLVPLFSTVDGNGSNTTYTIVGFAGVRILDAKKTGANKYVSLQPANIKHDSFVMGDSGFESRGAISDPQLTK